jgi:hypothetical protein
MKIIRVIFFIPILFLILMNGCTDDPPNAVGVSILPSRDGFNILSFDTTANYSSSYLKRLSGASTLLMLGKYQDNEAASILTFNLDSTLFPGSKIDSATLFFHIGYKFKDSVGTIGFQIRNMRSSWTAGTYTWDSLSTSSYSDTILESHVMHIQPGDTTLSIRLDTAVVRSWIWSGMGKCSIILLPTSSSTMILGLSSSGSTETLMPKLSIAYHDSVDSSRVDSIFTTTKVYVANNTFPVAAQHFFVQGAVADQGLLKFDVSRIPKNVSITSATLQLSLDTTLSVRGYSTDSSLTAYIALDDSAKPTAGGLYGTGSFINSHTVTFPIASVVQQWVTKQTNHGVIIEVTSDYINFDRYSFYDFTAAPSLRPTLTVKYSVVR